jgi:hypothetical protein
MAGKKKPIETAILKTLPEAPECMPFDDLVDTVARQVNPLVFPLRKTISQYTKVVQLELERRGLIERVPGVIPLSLRRPIKGAKRTKKIKKIVRKSKKMARR